MRVSRRGAVDPFIVMDVMEAARTAEAEGRHIIHMEVGQPGTPAPAAARAALAAALESSALGYTVGLGLPALRARIARLYGEWYGLDLAPERVVITPGASGAFLLAFTALFDAGEKVGVGMPGYTSYRNILGALSLETVPIATSAAARFQPAPADLPADLKQAMLILGGAFWGQDMDPEKGIPFAVSVLLEPYRALRLRGVGP